MKTRVKICCIASVDEARMAVEAGAAALGLVSAMPSGPGPISEDLITQIVATVPPGVATFLLTCQQNADAIIAQQRRTGASTLQLCDSVRRADYETLRRALPGIKLVQVIHVCGEESIVEARTCAPHVDAILLDSGNPSLAVKELGGTGRVHNWEISARLREAIAPVPVWLAGGLKPENVAEAIDRVQPFGVDICSGLRTNGRLDQTKLFKFMKAIP